MKNYEIQGKGQDGMNGTDGFFAGKIAVVTGGATGIGLGLALGMARHGATLVLASTNEERLARAVEAISALAATAEAFPCNVADRAAVKSLADHVLDRYGRVDLLFANAGVTTSGPFLSHTDGDWDWVYDVVLRGVTNCIQSFYPAMAKQGQGQIVITGSQVGLVPDWVLGHGPYTSAKAAVTALAVALRPEAADHGVGVSLFIPAGVETDIINSNKSRPESYGPSAKDQITVREGAPGPIPGTKFMMTPEDVARIVLPGVARNDAIIVTHGGLKPLAEEYFGRFLSAYDEALARG